MKRLRVQRGHILREDEEPELTGWLEHDEYVAMDGCTYCGLEGHRADACPHKVAERR